MGRSTEYQHVGDLFGGRARLSRLRRRSDERGTPIPVNSPHLPFLVAPAGRVVVAMRFRSEQATLVLGAESDALLIRPGIRSRQTDPDDMSRLVVFADQDDDPVTDPGGRAGKGE